MPSLSLTQAANSACLSLGVLDSGESLSSQQYTDALGAANNMLESWTNEQVSFIKAAIAGFALAGGTYTPAPLLQFADMTTPLTVPSGYVRAIELGLAIELAPQYDTAPSQTLVHQANEARAAATPFVARLQSTPDPFAVAVGTLQATQGG